METHDQGLRPLSRAQCLRLLSGIRIGRVVVTLGAFPAAFPVNFALLDDDVVFRTAPGTKLSAALAGAAVAFQADRIDPIRGNGWSVLLQGSASILTAPEELERARALRIRPWAPGDRPHFVRIRAEVVSGRRLPTTHDALAVNVPPALQKPALRFVRIPGETTGT